jgi:hypothetical protein
MQSQLSLSVSLIRRIVTAIPADSPGEMDIDLGSFGIASIALHQLHIGMDVLKLPFRFRVRRNSDRKGLEANMELTNWRISEETIWFTLERIGNLKGPLFEAARRGLIAVITKIVRQRTGNRIQTGQRVGELGIPLDSFMGKWWNKELPVTINDIELKNGVVLYITER